MKRFLIVVAVLAVAVVLFFVVPRTGTATIDVTGPAGKAFKGSCVVDGTSRDLSGVVPAHFSFSGREVAFEIELQDDGVYVDFAVDGLNHGRTGSSGTSPTYVRGSVEYRPLLPLWHIGGSNRPGDLLAGASPR